MDFEWVAIALTDVTWITLAFVFGFLAKQVNLPPLVGFLATGFVLNYYGITGNGGLEKLADLGITLLLFTVGLKLNLKVLLRPQVWSVTVIHLLAVTLIFGLGIYGLAQLNLPVFSELDFNLSILIAFALSFSSTVFVVKSLEAKSEMKSLHGQIAIGILIMQDLAAVIFLTISSGKIPNYGALFLLLLIPLRPILFKLLVTAGHGELLILYALVLALGGAELFEMAGVKDDLGALIMGILMSSHPKAKEMARSMLGFKDLFLVGFFLNIGISGELTSNSIIIGMLLVPFIFIKSSLFFMLMTQFKLRARTSLLATINLTNYSEFGLIVMAIGVSNNWISKEWLAILAVSVSISFIIAAVLNSIDNKIYSQLKSLWLKFQSRERLADDRVVDIKNGTIAIFGMGRVGAGAYCKMHEIYGDKVVGIDFDADIVEQHQLLGRNVIYGDPSDTDFWEKVDNNHHMELVMLALPKLSANLEVLEQLKEINFSATVHTIARYTDEVEVLKEAGASEVFNIYSEAGTGFAEHVIKSEPIEEN